jgi:hypothetical protein
VPQGHAPRAHDVDDEHHGDRGHQRGGRHIQAAQVIGDYENRERRELENILHAGG